MNMKKLGALLMALVMVLSLSVTAFAADPADKTGMDLSDEKKTASHDVLGKVVGDDTTAKKYSVDVTWGSMVFTYDIGSNAATWNPETHVYDATSTGTSLWSCAADADKVTVTNHSNAAVNVAFAFSGAAYTTVTASLKNGDTDLVTSGATLATAENTLPAEAPSVTGTVSLTGSVPTTMEDNTKLFTLTVTLTKVTD